MNKFFWQNLSVQRKSNTNLTHTKTLLKCSPNWWLFKNRISTKNKKYKGLDFLKFCAILNAFNKISIFFFYFCMLLFPLKFSCPTNLYMEFDYVCTLLGSFNLSMPAINTVHIKIHNLFNHIIQSIELCGAKRILHPVTKTNSTSEVARTVSMSVSGFS